jgi:hypothetical protein
VDRCDVNPFLPRHDSARIESIVKFLCLALAMLATNFEHAERGDAAKLIGMRHVFIVSRDHPWLYRHLVERFQDDPDVHVILDRRIAERRTAPPTAQAQRERRRTQRRRAVPPEDDLRTRSHYIVEV